MPISTPQTEIQAAFEAQSVYQASFGATSARERCTLLRQMRKQVLAFRPQFHAALQEDLGKHEVETDLTEISLLLSEIQHTLQELYYWMKPERVASHIMTFGTQSHILRQPKGLVLIIAPWNYPLMLALVPLVGAIAAGNCVVLKPSELAPATAAVLSDFIRQTSDPRIATTVQGNAETAQHLLNLPFNHFFFTGSTKVGKIVQAAAAQHLASVTLELGGKSPVIVDESAKIKDVAQKLMTKWLNAGQICIAADYVFVHRSQYAALILALQHQLTDLFGAAGEKAQTDASYCRIVSETHAKRQQYLIQDALEKGAALVFGGKSQPELRWVGPTILTQVSPDMLVLQEEIFGPILPIMAFDSLEEPLTYINAQPKPLALYIFSESRCNQKKIIANTRAGGTMINDAMLQILNPHLPFGGSNSSGIGNYHGHYSFLAFTEARSIMRQQTWFNFFKFLYPPYKKSQKRLTRLLLWWLSR